MSSAYKDKKPQTQKNRHFFQSLGHAIQGLVGALVNEANLRRDLVVTLLVIIGATWLRVDWQSWLFLTIAIMLVFLSEMWNTVVENLVDLLVEKHYHPLAKRIKDMSAACVLVSALLAIIIGLIVFGKAIF